MARYKHYSYDQSVMIPISFKDQIVSGTFEHTLNYVVDNELDLSVFENRFNNDETGRPAYDPKILLKIVLFAYSRGITSSRQIEKACDENIIFMALSADTHAHYTTIADFISRMKDVIKPLFLEILLVCDDLGLIGKEMFAIDGCKMPSNASKEWSGTHKELKKKRAKIDRAVERILSKHRDSDLNEVDESIRDKELKQIEKLKSVSEKIKNHLNNEEERIGRRGKPIKSNITDNESAKMKSGKGVIQGYNGIASVDSKNQVIVHAEAIGSGSEQQTFKGMVEGTQQNLNQIGHEENAIQDSIILADSGFYSNENIDYLYDNNLDGYIVDNQFRKRDPRFADAAKYKPPKKEWSTKRYSISEFNYDPKAKTCICPAGKPMWHQTKGALVDGKPMQSFTGYKKNCDSCPLRAKCLRKPDQKTPRQVAFFGEPKQGKMKRTNLMKEKIDSEKGRYIYSYRLGTVEPVFGNIGYNKKLNRFSHRGITKVNAQWLMYCLVHNIEKISKCKLAV